MKFDNVKIIPKIMSFADKVGDVLKVVTAFLVGYAAFMANLKGEDKHETE